MPSLGQLPLQLYIEKLKHLKYYLLNITEKVEVFGCFLALEIQFSKPELKKHPPEHSYDHKGANQRLEYSSHKGKSIKELEVNRIIYVGLG